MHCLCLAEPLPSPAFFEQPGLSGHAYFLHEMTYNSDKFIFIQHIPINYSPSSYLYSTMHGLHTIYLFVTVLAQLLSVS